MKKCSRIAAMLLAVLFLLGTVAVSAFAVDESTTAPATTKAQNTITYQINGFGTQPEQYVTTAKRVPALPVLEGDGNHVFNGWYYDTAFTRQAKKGQMFGGNITLYAQWLIQPYLSNLVVGVGTDAAANKAEVEGMGLFVQDNQVADTASGRCYTVGSHFVEAEAEAVRGMVWLTGAQGEAAAAAGEYTDANGIPYHYVTGADFDGQKNGDGAYPPLTDANGKAYYLFVTTDAAAGAPISLVRISTAEKATADGYFAVKDVDGNEVELFAGNTLQYHTYDASLFASVFSGTNRVFFIGGCAVVLAAVVAVIVAANKKKAKKA